MIELFLDTTDRLKAKITIKVDEKKYREIIESEKPQSNLVLPAIEKLCDKAGILPEKIEKISVATGPGSYTGVRLGISIANAFGLAVNIPVNNTPKGSLIQAHYL